MKPSDILSYTLVKACHHESYGKHKIYAVATDKRGRILAEAGNSYCVSHPAMAYYAKRKGNIHQIFLHAEIALLVKLTRMRIPLDNVHIYVARSNNKGQEMLAMCCPICYAALTETGIYPNNIHWTGEQ